MVASTAAVRMQLTLSNAAPPPPASTLHSNDPRDTTTTKIVLQWKTCALECSHDVRASMLTAVHGRQYSRYHPLFPSSWIELRSNRQHTHRRNTHSRDVHTTILSHGHVVNESIRKYGKAEYPESRGITRRIVCMCQARITLHILTYTVYMNLYVRHTCFTQIWIFTPHTLITQCRDIGYSACTR